MTRKDIINEFNKAEINFDYANNKDNGYSADYISEDFSRVLDLVETLVNKNSVLNSAMPSSCVFNGHRRAIIKETESFYFFASGNRFKWSYAEKHLCTELKH
jgi:hypothetical protein